jgi:hypothetical protein
MRHVTPDILEALVFSRAPKKPGTTRKRKAVNSAQILGLKSSVTAETFTQEEADGVSSVWLQLHAYNYIPSKALIGPRQ